MSLIQVRHRSLHVLVNEPPRSGNARPDVTIFFVHGAMASLEQWRFQIQAMANLFRVVAYDYFGCGNSPKLYDSWESYSTEEHLADLLALFDERKSKYNFLVGHSFGTSQVLRISGLRPIDVTGCVLVAPALFADGGHPIFRLPEFLLNWLQPTLSQSFFDLALHPTTRDANTEEHQELVKFAKARANSNSMHVAKSFYRQIKFIKENEVKVIDGKIPMLVICGSDDQITPMEMADRIIQWLTLRQLTPQGKVRKEIVGPASHQVMEEQPASVNKLILDFFRESLSITSSSSNEGSLSTS